MPVSQDLAGLPERFSVLQRHHAADIPRRQAELLTLLAAGLSNHEAAAVMSVAPQTIHRHSQEARLLVVPPALEPTRDNAVAWAWLHRNCCLATEFARLWRV